MTIEDSGDIVAEKGVITPNISKPSKCHKSLEERLLNYKGGDEHVCIDWGKPVGKEIW